MPEWFRGFTVDEDYISSNLIVPPKYPSDTYATALEEIAEWGKIYRVTAGAGALTFYATAVPNVDLSFKARCVRK